MIIIPGYFRAIANEGTPHRRGRKAGRRLVIRVLQNRPSERRDAETGGHSNHQVAFEPVGNREGIRPVIAAEIDDRAMTRLSAGRGADCFGAACDPSSRVAARSAHRLYRFTEIRESFDAVSPG